MNYIPKSSFIMEMCEVIARHMRATGTWPNCSGEDIHESADRYEQIPGWYYDALAYLKEKNYYYSLDEVGDPKEGMCVSIRLKGETESYQYHKDKWVFLGQTYDDMYKI